MPLRREKRPDWDKLENKRIGLICVGEDKKDPNNKGIEQWYFGKVEKIIQGDDGACAEIEWEKGGEKMVEKLGEDMWARPRSGLVVHSWMLA